VSGFEPSHHCLLLEIDKNDATERQQDTHHSATATAVTAATIKKSCNSLGIMFCNSDNTVIVLILKGVKRWVNLPSLNFT
jgi:hypothetical protein